jgi:phage/plasmid-associated DNA primase
MNFDAMKDLETGDTIHINEKFIAERDIENTINNIYLSNHRIPFKIDENDRRYVVLETNNKYAKGSCSDEARDEYFSPLYSGFDDEYYDNLLTSYLTRDISGYKPFNIPETEIKKDIVSASKDSVQSFVEEYNEILVQGELTRTRTYELYVDYCKSNGFMTKKSTTFGGEIKGYCNEKQKRVGDKREWRYTLKPEFIKKDDEE